MTTAMPTSQELAVLFKEKYGSPSETGWAPRRRWHAGYFLPSDIYEATVARFVTDGARWVDIGGGHSIFPENPALARRLVSRCASVVAIDPSDNVKANQFVHETQQSTLEDYSGGRDFDLATMRMVLEHVANPHEFVRALSGLVRPGGIAIALTVDLWSPVTVVSRLTPFGLHHAIKRLFWGGDEADTFPAHYLMNTRAQLSGFFREHGFEELDFAALDDLSVFGQSKTMNRVELMVRRALRATRLPYPERCLIGIYRKADTGKAGGL